MNYRIMEVYATQDVSDPDKSDYDMIELLPNMPALPAPVRRLVVRPDVAQTYDLFNDSFFTTELLCSEAFALRVLGSGCTGMLFVDPSSFGDGEPICRTLRGIEKLVGWDAQHREITELIEAID